MYPPRPASISQYCSTAWYSASTGPWPSAICMDAAERRPGSRAMVAVASSTGLAASGAVATRASMSCATASRAFETEASASAGSSTRSPGGLIFTVETTTAGPTAAPGLTPMPWMLMRRWRRGRS